MVLILMCYVLWTLAVTKTFSCFVGKFIPYIGMDLPIYGYPFRLLGNYADVVIAGSGAFRPVSSIRTKVTRVEKMMVAEGSFVLP